jgi:excinuclease UvrABC nuclease subunit
MYEPISIVSPTAMEEESMTKKTVKMNIESINKLPQDKPVVYKILNDQGENIYTGVAKRGNVQNRLRDHLPSGTDAISGASKVQIDQMPSIDVAKRKEANIISRTKPKYNKQGK